MLVRIALLAVVLTLSPSTCRGAIESAGPAPAGGATARPDPSAAGPPSHLRPRGPALKPEHSSVPPGRDPCHVEVKFLDGLAIGLDPSGTPSESHGRALRSPRALALLDGLRGAGARWRRSVALDRATLERLRERARNALHREIADFSDYFTLELPPGSHAEEWMDALNALPEVELAAPQPLPAPAPMPPDFEPLQGYLGAAPEGSDAQFAWTIPGGTGAGVSICDIENSWNFNHQDLPPATVLVPDGETWSDPLDDTYHGTAVLGEMFSLRNGWGMTGASYEARCYVAPQALGSGYWLPQAILLAAARLEPGDVILIELGTWGPYYKGDGTQFGTVPAEWERSVYEAILVAVGNGIHVVEPAANGSQDLDDPVYRAGNFGHAPFLPENNSGAILVGAGVPPVSSWRGPDRSRLSFSDYGSRLDVQGWGVDVPTTGPGDLYMSEGPDLSYTRSFGGTSAAGPLVASAVASVEGIVEARGLPPVAPAVMRTLLAETGAPQQDGVYPASQYIGPRPDLRAAFERMGAPILSAPDSVGACEGDTILVLVRAADLDGDPIDLLTADPLPAGATFIPAPDRTSGLLEWAIARGQAGPHAIRFRAANAQEGTATTVFTVRDFDRPPVIEAPGGWGGFEGYPLWVDVSASDPNGDRMVSFEAEDLPDGATFTADSTMSRARLTWTPAYDQAGQYRVTLTAASLAHDGPEGATRTVSIPLILTIRDLDRPPVVTAPQSVQGQEGLLLSFRVSAADPDGDAIGALTVASAPPGASFEVDEGNAGGDFHWTPGYDQSGSWTAWFTATSRSTGTAATMIAIADVDRPPVVTAPKEVDATEGTEVAFEVTASDPDGDRIVSLDAEGIPPGSSFETGAGAGDARFSWVPPAGSAGRYEVIVRASSLGHGTARPGTLLVGSDSVSLLVRPGVLPARVSLPAGTGPVRLGTGASEFRVRIEPLDSLFAVEGVDPGTVVMISPDTGPCDRIAARGAASVTDADQDGIRELTVGFRKDDLRLLFAGLAPGPRSVGVTLEGNLAGGSRFRGSTTLDVHPQGRPEDARVTPNPTSGSATLTVRTTAAGPLRLRVFDARGRLVRVVSNEPAAKPGYHDLPLGGPRGAARLPAGIYFYRLEYFEGAATGRFVVLR
jgi:serine protease